MDAAFHASPGLIAVASVRYSSTGPAVSVFNTVAPGVALGANGESPGVSPSK